MRIDDVSPRVDNTTIRLSRDLQSVSGKAWCCALSRRGNRAYLGGHSGVWRSDDGGVNWFHLEWPQPPPGSSVVPGALLGPTIYDILVSHANQDLVFAAVGRDARRPAESGIWRSADGGASWTRVHQFVGAGATIEQANCLAMAPDDPNLVFCAGGLSLARSTDGGLTWTNVRPQQNAGERVWYVVVARRQGAFRRVYAVGSRVWISINGGTTWRTDPQPLSLGQQGGAPGDGPGPGARSIAIHPTRPGVLYVATFEANPAINNSEGIVWRGEIGFSGASRWLRLPPIPLDYPTVTDSGGGFVVPFRGGLIASDRRTVHAAFDDPAVSSDWVRIEDSRCHLDPHCVSATPTFRRRRPGQPAPSGFGRILLVNDGGANVSTDGARSWKNARGLSTLGIVNVAINPRKNALPAICMGMGDNSGFSSPDGGAKWETQDYRGGDNDCAFADPRQPSRLIVFAPREGRSVFVYSRNGGVPDASVGTSDRRSVPGPSALAPDSLPMVRRRGSTFVSSFVNVGYRPLIMTVAGEPTPAEPDVIVVRYTPTSAVLLRTRRIKTITRESHWRTNATSDGPGVKVFRQGPLLPSPNITAVQASGGHDDPTYYVGDIDDAIDPFNDLPAQGRVWKWTAGMRAWQQIVPAGPVSGPPGPRSAQRFFVDPYGPFVIYVLGPDRMYRSNDGGATWVVDTALEQALTENGAFPIVVPFDGNPGQALLRDMQFDPVRFGTRFAIGPAGVFQTLDGVQWTTLLSASASACRPMNAAYDFVSCPRALYVATSNRGLLRLSPITPDWDYPMNSVQAAEGLITLLRAHRRGGKFGPPDDQLDAEVIVFLDTEPEKAFGLRLRADNELPAAKGMLGLLRDAFNRNRPVRLEFVRSGCRTGRIIRVTER
jgi:hypothetical protein